MSDVFAGIAGAVADEGGVAHFGDPFREQRALRNGSALAPRADRRVISVSGPDRLTWLDSFTSQAVARAEPGRSTELLVLDPHGRVEHAAGLLDDGETSWLLVDRGDAEGLTRWLGMMRFRSRVEVALHDDLVVVGFLRGGDAERIGRAVAQRTGGLALVWDDPWTSVGAGGWQYAVSDAHPGVDYAWSEAILPAEAAVSLVGESLAGLLAVEALRIAAWRPRWAAEVDERSLPHEVDWLRSAVHLDKGCYRGQETVAKVHNLGHPPRRLVLLHLDGSDAVLPVPGDAVFDGDTEVGRITSSARHFELGPIALAVVARRTPGARDLRVVTEGLDVAAAQEAIVPPDAGATADVPRLTRLSRRPLAQ